MILHRRTAHILAAFAAVCLALLSVTKLEALRSEVNREEFAVGATPATLLAGAQADGPLVVIAHGFAGSRQLMDAYALTLARTGYRVVSFDFEGHGRNPVAMGGEVTALDGTTRRLIVETDRVVRAAIAKTGWSGPVALVGHSMASDIIIRAALENDRVGPLVAISMFSEAITAEKPTSLLVISGQWEKRLRAEALEAVQQLDPTAQEGATVQTADVRRRTIVAPMVEHVGVLYSTTALEETRSWLDGYYGRPMSNQPVASTGPWIALLMASLVLLGNRIFSTLPRQMQSPPVPRRTFLAALIIAPAAAPLVAVALDLHILPVLVADYLALHLMVYGLLQLGILWASGIKPDPVRWLPMGGLLLFCIGVFGLALDRYVASFVPTGARTLVFAAVVLGALPFMLADTMLTASGTASLGRRLLLRVAFLTSLGLAVTLDPGRLMFLLIILPVIVLYFAVFGLIARPVARRAGSTTAGVALGLVLAWSLASAFPVFSP